MTRIFKHFLICIARNASIFCAKYFGGGFLGSSIASIPNFIIKNNRTHLASIPNWVPAGLLDNSVFRYGINSNVEPLLNLPLSTVPTNADLLAFFASRYCQRGHYLEIGVSVGKTFWQMLNSANHFDCWAFDIEEINPVLEKELIPLSRLEWQTPSLSTKKTVSSFSTFHFQKTGRKVCYICADVFDPHAWSFLKNTSFNIILSDALHSPKALDFEWRMLTTTNCFNRDSLLVMWDDLDSDMRAWFLKKKIAMSEQLEVPISQIGAFYLNGWLGSREYPHRFGCLLKGFQ
jgi:hypothetical protein